MSEGFFEALLGGRRVRPARGETKIEPDFASFFGAAAAISSF